MKVLIALAVALSAAISTASGAVSPADEAVGLLQEYIRVDTTNPPGNEKAGAIWLAAVLKKNGIDAEIFETAPGRACVYARLKGTGKKRPLVLLNHIDVVPAQASDWTQPPFGGVIADGEIWGRGTIDMKGMGIAELESLLMLKRSGKTLDRDVIFLGTPDEEVGGTYGAEWFVKNQPNKVKDAEFLINEGFFIDAGLDGKAKYWGVDVAEKSVLWLRLTAKGDAGHGSMPMPDSAPNRLVQALARVVDSPPKPEVPPAVKAYFENIASVEAEPLNSLYKTITTSVDDEASYKILLKDKLRSSMLRNTVSLTVLKAGYKTNVIPAEASAELDCRLLPEVDKDKFIAGIKKTISDNSIEISVVDWVHGAASPFNSELFDVIKQVAQKNDPGLAVVPVVVPWFTDSHWFRDFGTIAYGFEPFRIDPQHLASMHGKNERIPVESYKRGVMLLNEIVEKMVLAK